VNYEQFMHILQASRNTNQLNGSLVKLLRGQVTAYKIGAVYIPVSLDELVDVSVVHPFGNESKPVFV